MTISVPLSQAAVATFCDSVFSAGDPLAVPAYSPYGFELQEFRSARDLASFIDARRAEGAGSIQIAVHYPDTGGSMEYRRVALDPAKCEGATFRFTAEGWGLIRVNLHLSGSCVLGSFVSANSEKRAMSWFATYPELGSPERWHWAEVSRHLRRLRRSLAGAI